MPQYLPYCPPHFPRDEVVVRGKVEGTASKRRFLFFRDEMLLIALKPEDHAVLKAQAERRVGHGWRMPPKVAVGPALYGKLEQYPVGHEVEIVFSLGNEISEYYSGLPIVGVTRVQPA